jgi:biopolymer transport protein ExbB
MKTTVSTSRALFAKALLLISLGATWAVTLPVAAQDELPGDKPATDSADTFGDRFAEPSGAAAERNSENPGAGRRASTAGIPTRLSDMFLAGGPLMWPILLCSIVVVTFSVERLVVLRRRRVIPRDFVKRFLDHLAAGQLDRSTALALCEQNGSPIAEVFAHGVRKWGKPSVEVEQAIIDGGERQVSQLRKNLRIMNTIATVSPLLGLLGTVQGMILSFNRIATTTAHVGKSEDLARGIGMALIATAGGLIVAIPALVIYMYLGGRVDALVMEMDALAQKVVNLISAEGLQAGELPRIAPRPKTIGTSALKNS